MKFRSSVARYVPEGDELMMGFGEQWNQKPT